MSENARSEDRSIEIGTDRRFQERFWTAQRIAWVVFVLIILAALAGFSGKGGPFAHGVADGAEADLEYPRYTRWLSSDDMELTLAPTGAAEATVDISSDFFDIFQIENVRPAPKDSSVNADGQTLVFALESPGGSRDITFNLRAIQPSAGKRFTIRIDDGPPLAFRSVVLP